MTVEFVPVKTDEDIARVAKMAGEIWNEYWPPIIGQAQTNYMVEHFQSLPAFTADVKDKGYEYWFITVREDETPVELAQAAGDAGLQEKGFSLEDAVENQYAIESERDSLLAKEAIGAACEMPQLRIVGYTGGHGEEDGRFFISKIYLVKDQRGKGLCPETIRFYEALCRDRGLHAMYLTVNKHNDLGIRAYKGKGFEVIDAAETNIGEGFVMDDYIMEKKLR